MPVPILNLLNLQHVFPGPEGPIPIPPLVELLFADPKIVSRIGRKIGRNVIRRIVRWNIDKAFGRIINPMLQHEGLPLCKLLKA